MNGKSDLIKKKEETKAEILEEDELTNRHADTNGHDDQENTPSGLR